MLAGSACFAKANAREMEVALMIGLRDLRSIIDRFCAEQGLSIASVAGMDAARHCLAQAAARNLDEREMLAELFDWYQLYAKRRADSAIAADPTLLRGAGTKYEQAKAA
jgi:hypothetical protein